MKAPHTSYKYTLCFYLLLSLLLGLLLPANSFAQATSVTAAAGQPAANGWDARFGALGLEGTVAALAITANGDLYAGGNFQRAGGVDAHYIARWDGQRWHALGQGLNGTPKALAADGNTLYVIGDFTTAGNVTVNQLAHWDGTTWSAVGTGVGAQADYPSNGRLEALAAHNGQLYIGGHFDSYEGAPAVNIAQWDGSRWSALGSGLGQADWDGAFSSTGAVKAIAVAGSDVYAGGDINLAGTIEVNGVAHWDGNRWSALGRGVTDGGLNNTEWGIVSALATQKGALYAAGRFTQAGGTPAANIAQWDGNGWHSLGTGILDPQSEWDIPVNVLLATENTLYVGGTFQSAGGQPIALIAQWRNNGWSAVGNGLDNEDGFDYVTALARGADGSLYSGGRHQTVGGKRVDNLGRWNGAGWSPLNNGLLKDGFGVDPAEVRAIVEDRAGRVYAAGLFGIAGGTPVSNLALLENGVWQDIGGSNARIHALALDGDNLYVAGAFTQIGGIAANHIARWHRPTGQWSALGQGINGDVHTLAVADGILYAGGAFKAAGTVNAEDVAWWDGTAWHPFGTTARIFAILGASEVGTYVNALAVRGNLVYIGGVFETIQFGTNVADRNSFAQVNHLVAWDRAADQWIYVGPENAPGVIYPGLHHLDIGVNSLMLVEDLLVVGGKFSQIGGQAVTGLAFWDSVVSQWSTFPANLGAPGTPQVLALAHHGSDLIIGGHFTSAGTVGNANFVARLDMATGTWSDLHGGVRWDVDFDTRVLSLAASATGVYVGGKFDKAGGFSAPGFARWNGALGGSTPDPNPTDPNPTDPNPTDPNPTDPTPNLPVQVYLPLVQR